MAGIAFPSFMGGVGVVFNNVATPSSGAVVSTVDLRYYRAAASFSPWGQCTGSNVWDDNQLATEDPCLDQTGIGKGDLLAHFNPTPIGWPHELVGFSCVNEIPV